MIRAIALQNRFLRLRQNKLFELFVISVIVLSALVIGAKTYAMPPLVLQAFAMLDTAITIFFLVEIIVRMIAEGNLRRFFRQGWNVFDFIIVVTSLIPVEDSEAALLGRLLRIFRVLRLVSVIPELRVLLNAFLKAIPRMGYVALLMFLVFYIYGAIGSMLFHAINPDLWANITVSMLTLFRVATFEDWTDVMYETMVVYPLSWVFYLTFIFIVAFVFLNMMIGIVLDTLQREHESSSDPVAEQMQVLDQRLLTMTQQLQRLEQQMAHTACCQPSSTDKET
ncbi:MAG: ion transporter [Pseudomonadota bacterium]